MFSAGAAAGAVGFGIAALADSLAVLGGGGLTGGAAVSVAVVFGAEFAATGAAFLILGAGGVLAVSAFGGADIPAAGLEVVSAPAAGGMAADGGGAAGAGADVCGCATGAGGAVRRVKAQAKAISRTASAGIYTAGRMVIECLGTGGTV